ncbi:MAG: serine hydrolase domain-containing protein [Thermoanaerobaculia bacterium]
MKNPLEKHFGRLIPAVSLALLALGCASAPPPAPGPRAIRRLDGSTIQADALTARIEQLMKAGNVHGLAVGVFNDRETVYLKAFGVKSTATGEPLRTDTNFYGASLSKAVSAVLVMRLVEEGLIDLDTPLVKYLARPAYTYKATVPRAWHQDLSDLEGDELHKKITARMCLSHTTGFANWRWDEKDQKLRVNFEPGTRYSYSGEGFTFLQRVFEERAGKTLEELMQEKIFALYGMTSSSFRWQPEFEKNYCFGHSKTGEVLEKDKDNEPRAPSTLETTPEDYARFLRGVLRGDGLKEASWREMFSPQIRLHSKQQMGPLSRETTNAFDHLELAYGLGWGLLTTPYGKGTFKEGHGDGFQHYTIIFPERGLGVMLLSNSDNAEGIFKDLLEATIRDVYTPWEWQKYIPYDQAGR